ncbi:MAG: hypothetical protein WDZ88_03800 [Candidatus Paceibacterota bacterium]
MRLFSIEYLALLVLFFTPIAFVSAQFPSTYAVWGENPEIGIVIEDNGTYSVPFNEEREMYAVESGSPVKADLYFLPEPNTNPNNREFTKEIVAYDGTWVTWDKEGVYELDIYEGYVPVLVEKNARYYIARLLGIKTAHAEEDSIQTIRFTIKDINAPPEPEIDPLILKYEPILLMHPDERFFPMNVEAFVATSTLWDRTAINEIVLNEGEVTMESIADEENSEKWYLSFADGDVVNALTKYQTLVEEEYATTTYYVYKMEDSFVDGEGTKHEYIVLQYWYFYAFNDWKEHGGFNNHEGDWESVFIFLEKDTEKPKFVAYSQHHNRGEETLVKSYGSVRRKWNSSEIEKEGTQVKSYVALGAHANYPNNGNDGVHDDGIRDDLTSSLGFSISSDILGYRIDITTVDEVGWLTQYKGQWGHDFTDFLNSDSGPRGPYFLDVSGIERFHHPIEWAGIDNYTEKVLELNRIVYGFQNQSTQFSYHGNVPPGETLSVDKHSEYISFGNNTDKINFTPEFWDIESSIPNESFLVDVTFTYDPALLVEGNVTEEDLRVFHYNTIDSEWRVIDSVLDTDLKTLTFTTDHFSRFAIGSFVWEPITDFLDIKKRWGAYRPKEGVRESKVRIHATEGIDERVRLIVTDINREGVYLVNNTGTTTEGYPYIDIEEGMSLGQTEVALEFIVPPKKIIGPKGKKGKKTYVPQFTNFEFTIGVLREVEF